MPRSIWLPVALIWLVLALASFRNIAPLADAAFFMLLLVAIAVDRRSPAVLVLITLYAPVMLTVPRPYMVMFGVLLAAAVVQGKVRARVPQASATLLGSVMVFMAVSSLSLITGNTPDAATRQLGNYLEAVALVILLVSFLDSPDAVLLCIKSTAALAAAAFAIAVVHYLWRDSMWATQTLATADLGTDTQLGSSHYSITYGSIITGGRLVWAGVEPNYWGASLQFPLWLAVGLAGAARSRGPRLLWLLASTLILFSILGSFSRSSFLSVLLVLGIFGLRQRLKGVLPVMAFTATASALVLMTPLLQDRILGIDENIRTTGGTHRFDLWMVALSNWAESPIWGNGLGSFVARHGQAAHNTYLQVLAELGLVGASLYVAILLLGVLAWYRVRRAASRNGDAPLRWVAEGGLLGTLGTAVNLCTITAQDTEMLWLPVAIGVALWAQVRRMSVSGRQYVEEDAYGPGGSVTQANTLHL